LRDAFLYVLKLFLLVFFQLVFPGGDILEKYHVLLLRDTAGTQAPEVILEPEIPDCATKYTRRIADLEGRVIFLNNRLQLLWTKPRDLLPYREICHC
jgi:hypothetical protein